MTGQSRIAGLAFAATLLSAYPPSRLTAQDPWPVLDHASQTYQTIANLSADFVQVVANPMIGAPDTDRKSTRLNSSHLVISYAVFCLKKKKKKLLPPIPTCTE